MQKIVGELNFDKNTFYTLVVINNRVYTRCFHIDTEVIEQYNGAFRFYIALKKCVLKNIRNFKEG